MPDEGVDGVTLGELYRNLIKMQEDINRRFADLNQIISTRMLPNDVFNVTISSLTGRVLDLENDRRALEVSRRTMYVAVLGALVAAIGSGVFSVLTSVMR